MVKVAGVEAVKALFGVSACETAASSGLLSVVVMRRILSIPLC
jgi:hypothetical protein